MPSIYLFTYVAGQCGDFLCRAIAQDSNFYNLDMNSAAGKNNPWNNSNPLEEFDINFKSVFNHTPQYNITDETCNAIDNKFKDKNLIIPSHHYSTEPIQVNLPRCKYVKLYTEDSLLPLYYSLMWIKVSTQRFDSNHPKMPFYQHQLNLYRRNAKMQEIINQVSSRGFLYMFETLAIMEGCEHAIDSVKFLFDNRYQPISRAKYDNALNLNFSDIMLNPKDTVDIWKGHFDMESALNVNSIEQYHNDNIAMIESTFNKSYNSYVDGNWMGDLTAWIQSTCPGSY